MVGLSGGSAFEEEAAILQELSRFHGAGEVLFFSELRQFGDGGGQVKDLCLGPSTPQLIADFFALRIRQGKAKDSKMDLLAVYGGGNFFRSAGHDGLESSMSEDHLAS